MAINRKLIRLFQTQGTAFIIICKSNSKKAQQYAMLVFLRREILYKAVKYKEILYFQIKKKFEKIFTNFFLKHFPKKKS